MKANFALCLKETLIWEGGWSDHPSDPGGKTMWGVTEKRFHQWLREQGLKLRPVRTITPAERDAIYRTGYWDTVRGDRLASGVDLATFDYAVNSGPGRAWKALMKVIGGTDAKTVKRLCAQRLGFVQALSTFKVFGKGWTRRIAGIEAKGVAMALAALGAPVRVQQDRLNREAADAAKARQVAAKREKTSGQATGAGGAGGAGSMASDLSDWLTWGLFAAVAIGVLVLLYFMWRKKIERDREQAFAREARKEGA